MQTQQPLSPPIAGLPQPVTTRRLAAGSAGDSQRPAAGRGSRFHQSRVEQQSHGVHGDALLLRGAHHVVEHALPPLERVRVERFDRAVVRVRGAARAQTLAHSAAGTPGEGAR